MAYHKHILDLLTRASHASRGLTFNSHITFDLSTHYQSVLEINLRGIDIPYNVVGSAEYSTADAPLAWIESHRGSVSPYWFGDACADILDLVSVYSSSASCALDLDLYRRPQLEGLSLAHQRAAHFAQWRVNQLDARSQGRADLVLDWLDSLDRRSQA